MAIQLASELEQRIQDLVSSSGYDSVDAVIAAALDALEDTQADPELETLIREGDSSGVRMEVNDQFWADLRAETRQIAEEHQAAKARA